ncbi:MAG: Spy/CpxP family protein refolding chaperone [Caulobacter sp.]|nr:Spy/CpxP family protein refolding chaperone [Caulobacter sp.]
MTSILSRAALMAGVITLAGATVALAQTHPAPPADGAPQVERRVVIMGGPGGPGMHGPGGPGMMGGRHHGPMDPEKHAQHLRDVLQLRPDQEGALKAFIAATKPPEHPAPAADGAPKPRHEMPRTTPERLAMAEKMMAEHQARFKKRNDALRAFYGQLTPSQQKAFDALHMGMGGGRMHHPGGPGMERRVRVMHPGGPGAGAEGGPGGGMFIIGDSDGEEEFEIELDGGPDDSDD